MFVYTKEIPVREDYEIIVVGGGPAGCAAAAAAGREGCKVLLIESGGALGGMGTLGLVPTWSPFRDKEKIIYKGLAERMLNATQAAQPHLAHWVDWTPIDPEALKRAYDELLAEFHVDVLFHTLMVDVISHEGHIEGIITSSKDGLTLWRASMFVDCTGDADLAAGAGAPFVKGGEDGELQPASLCFTLTNVDEYAYLNGPTLHPNNPNSPIYQILREGKYPEIPDMHLCQALIGPRSVGFNAGHLWDVDPNDPHSVSLAQQKGRQLAKALRDALAEYVPAAFANAQLIQTAPLVGIRESRRIVGQYVLTKEDYLARRSFPDEIGRNCYYLDLHRSRSEEKAAATEGLKVLEQQTHRYGKGESHGIPYRCLVPQKVDNLLVAGRCISADRYVHGSVRVMPPCMVTGEAAGVAASMSLTAGSSSRVNVTELRKKLRSYGVYFEG